MKECSCVVGLVLSYPDGQSRWLAWVHCVVPGVPEGGPLRVGLPCRAGTFEDVGCGVLGQGFGEFELGSNSAMSVVQTALVVRDGFNYVFRVGADKRVAQVKVQTGRLLGDQVEIISGIKPEDKLVATGGGFLSDGDLVRVVEAAAPPAKPASK